MPNQLHQKLSSLFEEFKPIIEKSCKTLKGAGGIIFVFVPFPQSSNSTEHLLKEDPSTKPAAQPKEEKIYTHAKAVSYLNSCDKTLRSMVKDGRLVKIEGKKLRYIKSALDEAAPKLRNNYKKNRIR